jgi:sulfhydrogenase subunit beta (sulfur reductase)
MTAGVPQRAVITVDGVQALLDALRRHGWRVVGPIVRDHVIVHDTIISVTDLPGGWTDEQDNDTIA